MAGHRSAVARRLLHMVNLCWCASTELKSPLSSLFGISPSCTHLLSCTRHVRVCRMARRRRALSRRPAERATPAGGRAGRARSRRHRDTRGDRVRRLRRSRILQRLQRCVVQRGQSPGATCTLQARGAKKFAALINASGRAPLRSGGVHSGRRPHHDTDHPRPHQRMRMLGPSGLWSRGCWGRCGVVWCSGLESVTPCTFHSDPLTTYVTSYKMHAAREKNITPYKTHAPGPWGVGMRKTSEACGAPPGAAGPEHLEGGAAVARGRADGMHLLHVRAHSRAQCFQQKPAQESTTSTKMPSMHD